jgi:hypothetical protein
MKIVFKKIALSSAIAAIVAPAAMAQSTDNPFLRGRYTAVTERAQPDFDPEVVRAGAFEISSSLGLSAEYNDNIFASETNEESDTILRIRPQADIRSNWSSHQLNAGVSVDRRQYGSNGSEDVTDYNAYVGGRLDVQRSFSLNGRVNGAHITEERYEPASATSIEPAQYDVLGANVGASYQRDRFQLTGTVGTREDDFDSPFNFRDVTDTFYSGRAAYAISPDVAFFVQGRQDDFDYDLPGTLADPSRDGKRTTLQLGTSFELQAPFRGEIAIGSVEDDKDARPDTDGLSVDGQLMWFPTQLTTVTLNASRGVFDPGLLTSASATRSNFSVHVDHELLRNVVLFGTAGFGKYDFEGTVVGPPPRAFDRSDEFTDVVVGAGYKLNKHARVDASYRLHSQDSSGIDADRDLDQNIFSISLKLFP